MQFSLKTLLATAFFSCFSLTIFPNVQQNEKKNIETLTTSAHEGDAEAQCLLGLNYYENDSQKSVYWMEKAAIQGHSQAQYFLGSYYLEGIGVEKNYEKACLWLDKSAAQNNAAAQFLIGLIYYRGDLTKQDYKKAFSWFKKAALQDNMVAQYHLGIMYFSGFGIQKNCLKAAEFFEKAALLGEAHAQYELGAMLMNGEGIKKDYVKATQWFNKSAEQGKLEAQSALGILYRIGCGVKKNPKISLYWLLKAASRGDRKGIQTLKEMFSPFQELYIVNLPDDARITWKIGAYQKKNCEYIFEYIPLNEEIGSWSQILTVSFVSNQTLNEESKTALGAMASMKRKLANYFDDRFELNVLQRAENDVVYESFIPGDENLGAEFDIVRLIKTSNGLHRISYARKGVDIEEDEKRKFLRIIQGASLINISLKN